MRKFNLLAAVLCAIGAVAQFHYGDTAFAFAEVAGAVVNLALGLKRASASA